MEFEIINNTSLPLYLNTWKNSDRQDFTYGDAVLNPDCVAFGIRNRGIPEALIVAELIDECAEIKILKFNSHDAVKELMKRFSDYCRSFDITKLKYELELPETDEKIFKTIITENGWNEPTVKFKTYELKKGDIVLSQKTKGNRPKGEIISFFETTQQQRLDMALKLSPNSPFYRMDNLVDKTCKAYVEDGVINGFVLVEYTENGIFAEMDRMSTETLAIVNLMTECADELLANGMYRVYVRTKSNYGEQVVKNVFANQIVDSRIIMYGE